MGLKRIRDSIGDNGTYAYGSIERLFHGVDVKEALDALRVEAGEHALSVRVEWGVVYLDSTSAMIRREKVATGSPRRLRWCWTVRAGRSNVHPVTGHRCTPAFYGGCSIYPDTDEGKASAWAHFARG